MKSIKDFDVKYVLTAAEQEEVVSGLAGCGCTVYGGGWNMVAGTLYVDGIPQDFHIWQDGDRFV